MYVIKYIVYIIFPSPKRFSVMIFCIISNMKIFCVSYFIDIEWFFYDIVRDYYAFNNVKMYWICNDDWIFFVWKIFAWNKTTLNFLSIKFYSKQISRFAKLLTLLIIHFDNMKLCLVLWKIASTTFTILKKLLELFGRVKTYVFHRFLWKVTCWHCWQKNKKRRRREA